MLTQSLCVYLTTSSCSMTKACLQLQPGCAQEESRPLSDNIYSPVALGSSKYRGWRWFPLNLPLFVSNFFPHCVCSGLGQGRGEGLLWKKTHRDPRPSNSYYGHIWGGEEGSHTWFRLSTTMQLMSVLLFCFIFYEHLEMRTVSTPSLSFCPLWT